MKKQAAFQIKPKNGILFVWQLFSFFILSAGIFLYNDERISTKEVLFIIIVCLIGGGISHISHRNRFEITYRYSIPLAAVIAFSIIVYVEQSRPFYLFFPDDPQITVTSEGSPVTLTWAYWAKTPQNLDANIYDWKGWRDISKSALSYDDSWVESENGMTCDRICTVTFEKGFHTHRPLLSFISETEAVVYAGENPYHLAANIGTPVFVSGYEFSRQLIFVLCFIPLWGVLSLILSFPLSFFKRSKGHIFKDYLIYALAFFIPIFVLLVICKILGIYPLGEKTFLISDMECQYVDFLVHLRSLLQNGRSLFYSFSKSLGDDYLSLFAYYLANPLDWLIVFFPDNRIPEAVSLIVILRFAFCGLTAAVYFRNVYHTKTDTLIFSTAYALMSFNFVIAEHTQLRNGVLLLPLVLYGIDRILQGKSGLLYFISLAVAMILNYYSAFQICYFAVPYFLFRLVLAKTDCKRIAFLRFVIYSILSAGICAVLLVPVAAQLGGGMKTFDLSVFTLQPNFALPEFIGKLFNSAFDQSQTLTSGFPNIFTGTLSVICLPLFFMNHEITRKEKAVTAGLLVFSLLTMQINALNLIAHGFNEPVWWPYRYSFIVSLFLLIPTVQCFQHPGGNSRFHLGGCFCIVLAVLWFEKSRTYSWLNQSAILLNILLCLVLTCILLSSDKAKYPLLSVFVFVFVDLFLNGWMILADKSALQRSEPANDFTAYYLENKEIINEIKADDSDLYRIEKNYFRDANDSFLLDYNGISHFSSTLKYKIMQFLPSAGYRFYPTRFEYGEGSTVLMDSLLGIRYLVTDEAGTEKPYDPVLQFGAKTVYSNPYALPIGFLAPENNGLSTDILEISNRFDFQNTIFTAFSSGEEGIFKEPEINFEQVADSEYIWHIKSEKPGRLYAYFDSTDEQEVCLSVNDIPVGTYFDGRGHPVLQLGSVTGGDEITVSMQNKDAEQVLPEILAQFSVEDENILRIETDNVRQRGLEILEYKDTHILGRVSSDDAARLFLSIPFDKGWRLKIDGKAAELKPAFDLFLSAEITPGTHEIQLDFQPVGLSVGTGVSVLSVIAAVFVSRKDRKFISRIAKQKP